MTTNVEAGISVFGLISSELSEIIEKLLKYEVAVVANLENRNLEYTCLQDFDLTIQILRDLKIVIETVGHHGKNTAVNFPAIPTENLSLERSKRKFCLQTSEKTPAALTPGEIQLFKPDQDSLYEEK